MREVFAVAAQWLREKRPFALATLVSLREAATAPIGTTIAVDLQGRIAGNIGAGCYESDIVQTCLKTAADGQTRRLDVNLTSEEELIDGTACGAVMQLVVWRPRPQFAEIATAIARGHRDVHLTIGEFEHVVPAKEWLILVGATSLAAELATLAQRLEFQVVVVDPRPAFATPQRVPNARIVQAWPDEYLPCALGEGSAVVVLSHDPKFDLPALRCALRSPARYIGLLGSRRSQAARRATLREEGFEEDEGSARISGPAGLDLGGVTVGETAVSILAEIVAKRRGGEGIPLSASHRAIHRERATRSTLHED